VSGGGVSGGFTDSDFEAAVARYLESRLDGAELAALNEGLRSDPVRRGRFVDICIVRAALIEHLKEEVELGRELEIESPAASAGHPDLNETMVAPALTDFVDPDEPSEVIAPPAYRNSTAPPRRGGVWKSAAALVLLVGLGIVIRSVLRGDKNPPVAVATGSPDTVAASGDTATSRDTAGAVGSALHLPTTVPAGTPGVVRSPDGVRTGAVPDGPELGRLVQAIDVGREGDLGGLFPGDKMPPGMHTLAAGVIRVEFANGTSVVVQGPSRFEIDSEKSIHLLNGRLCAKLVHDGSNLTVATPSMNAVDLGTEFGVDVSRTGQSYLEVFDGRVRAETSDAARGLSSRVVGVNDAVSTSVGSGTISAAVARPLAFVRAGEMTELAKSDAAPLRRWIAFSQVLRHDPDLTAYYAFDNREDAPGRLVNRAAVSAGKYDGVFGDGEAAASEPRWGPGRWQGKGALEFGGPAGSSVVRFTAPHGMIPRDAITLCVWLKRSERVRPVHFINGAVGNGTQFNVELMGTANKPPQKLLSENAYFTWCAHDVGSGPVLPADNGWHLICIASDASAVTKFFVDGNLVSTVQGEFKRPVSCDRMVLGNAVAGTEADRRDYFDGSVDELMIFKRVLSESEIRRIYSVGGSF
jgi:hypothetical protein